MVNDENLQTKDEQEKLDSNREDDLSNADAGPSLMADFSAAGPGNPDETPGDVSPAGTDIDAADVPEDTQTDTADVSAVEAREAQLAIDEENAEERRQNFLNADTVDRAVELDHRTFDTGVIREAYKKDQYVRSGNVTYPAPEPRPVGARPSAVAAELEEIRAAEEARLTK